MTDDIDDLDNVEEWGPLARALFLSTREALSPFEELRDDDRRDRDRAAKARQRARNRGETVPAICAIRGCGTQFPYQKGLRYCAEHRVGQCNTTNSNTSHP
jgi:hypothetical protein